MRANSVGRAIGESRPCLVRAWIRPSASWPPSPCRRARGGHGSAPSCCSAPGIAHHLDQRALESRERCERPPRATRPRRSTANARRCRPARSAAPRRCVAIERHGRRHGTRRCAPPDLRGSSGTARPAAGPHSVPFGRRRFCRLRYGCVAFQWRAMSMRRHTQTRSCASMWSRKRCSAPMRPGLPSTRQCMPIDIIRGFSSPSAYSVSKLSRR